MREELTTALARSQEFRRECRDERSWRSPGVQAEFILWGKLLPPEALGPRCYEHALKHLGSGAMGQIDQYAVFDLRPLNRLRESLRSVA